MEFAGKVVIVTGASSGIGAETAIQFAENGAKLTITGRNQQRLDDTLQKCISKGAKADDILGVVADLTKEQDITNIVDKTVDKFGQIDVLVNNAGVSRIGNLESTTNDELTSLMNANLGSMVELTRKAMPYLLKTKGNVVNASSISGHRSSPNVLGYALAKSAVSMFTQNIAMEFAAQGVRVNAISVGFIPTPMMENFGIEFTEENVAKIREHTGCQWPMQRVGELPEGAAPILFLASEKASYITGAILPVDGGAHCKPYMTS